MRQAEALAQLALGIEMFARFACEVGGVDEATAEGWRTLSIDALRSIGRREARHLGESDPAERFLSAIRDLRASQAAALLPRDPRPGEFELGEPIGYYDAAFVYLIPQAARKAVAQLFLRSGDTWTVTVRALDDALVQRGYVARDKEGRATRQMRLYGRMQRVLVIALRHSDGDNAEAR